MSSGAISPFLLAGVTPIRRPSAELMHHRVTHHAVLGTLLPSSPRSFVRFPAWFRDLIRIHRHILIIRHLTLDPARLSTSEIHRRVCESAGYPWSREAIKSDLYALEEDRFIRQFKRTSWSQPVTWQLRAIGDSSKLPTGKLCGACKFPRDNGGCECGGITRQETN